MSKHRQEEGIASYITVHIEYFVAIVDSDRLAPDEPDLEPSDQEYEIGNPKRDEEEELEDVIADKVVPKPVPGQLLRLYGEKRRVSHSESG